MIADLHRPDEAEPATGEVIAGLKRELKPPAGGRVGPAPSLEDPPDAGRRARAYARGMRPLMRRAVLAVAGLAAVAAWSAAAVPSAPAGVQLLVQSSSL